ncbi:unnamed protein product [Phytomonas sp. EM1]|nr:unnamed protein product [Phytomonas sp. EM1]|eukprot:CCW60967.1 unnamed protein product [Phytomonas sp. isolate EM1]
MLELDGRTLSYSEFKEKCLRPNLPAIIHHANGLSDSWFDVELLIRHLSPEGLLDGFGDAHIVPVCAISTPFAREASQAKGAADSVGDGSSAAVPLCQVLGSWLSPPPLLYLKDWHLQQEREARLGGGDESGNEAVRMRPHGVGLYRVPDYLGGDWLNGFSAEAATASSVPPLCGFGNGHEDYRFAYIGPTGTWTPLHYDVFGTYSWSFNVCGKKRWFFPTHEGNEFLKQHTIKGFPAPPDIRVLQGFEYWSFVQHPGELVFVPSHYYHQVHNVEGEEFELSTSRSLTCFQTPREKRLLSLSISVNHNWCNEFCIERMVRLFLDDASYLRQSLDSMDMAAAYGLDNPVLWAQKLEEMLLNGTNWSFRSMLSFLGYIQAQFPMLGESVINTLVSLESKVREAQATLFT